MFQTLRPFSVVAESKVLTPAVLFTDPPASEKITMEKRAVVDAASKSVRRGEAANHSWPSFVIRSTVCFLHPGF